MFVEAALPAFATGPGGSAYSGAARIEDSTTIAEIHGHEGELKQWDEDYWDERQSSTLFSVTEEQLRPYFPLHCVLSGLFQLSSILFGITVKPADQRVEVWHPDVKVFDVYDEKGSHIASFFLDLYSRPSEKERGSWTTSFISRSKLLGKKPVAFVVCNQLPPIGSTPSLMSFAEVKSLFHEFGHAMQHMLTTVPYAMAAGLNNIELDAVEFPSQFMENWLYDNNTIPLISGHYQTGKPLPQNIFAQILKAHHYGGGSVMLRQLFLAALDLTLHTRAGEHGIIISYSSFSSTDSWTKVVKKIAERFSVMKEIPESCILCTFPHIFSGGYAAGYYAYEWAEVLSQDAFGAFEDVGLQNRKAISKIGRRFRDTVLSLGGGTDPGEVFRMFRGQDPHLEFLLKAYGI
ncbi:probable cytosolic oligopeptidase A [Scyliorhinus canicula]|uniref:probable cytosolic oligopeptidase A n=1 Tax=Scyliorhinus canicula TaxID=7830 RepID=UPI0018F6C765|nr:probable cytosolic oligopeptidase A [Scyliorhinus canicula]